MGGLRIIAIILLIYLSYILFKRYVFPWLFRAAMNRAQRRFQDQFQQQFGQQHHNRPEGDVKVEGKGEKKKKQRDDSDDEYVEYEEVE